MAENRLNTLGVLIARLTYGEMIDLASGLARSFAPSYGDHLDLARAFHDWATDYATPPLAPAQQPGHGGTGIEAQDVGDLDQLHYGDALLAPLDLADRALGPVQPAPQFHLAETAPEPPFDQELPKFLMQRRP